MSEPAAAVVTPPLVAIVGRPNVGKSTLFNRLCGGHHAIVEDEPGVTRDRRYGEADWAGRRFRVVDTGGLDESAAQQSSIARGVRTQAIRAIDEAALLLFVVDAQEGLTTGDREVFVGLRRTGKPLLFVANKVDGSRHEVLAAEAYELGAEQVFAISAAHGRNLAELCDGILAALPDAPPLVEESTARPLRIALVGRPNAGKSSLVNRLVGAERVIVDPTPGTTRDPVDTPFDLRGHPAVLIDTAGIRKRARVELAMEKIAVTMAEKAIGRCDVAVLVIDGAGGVAEQEAKIAGLCQEAGRALVIAFNKRDLFPARDEKQRLEELERKLQFVPWAKVVFCSAHSGRGMESLLDAVLAVHASHNRRVATGELNRFFERLLVDHPPPVFRGHQVKLYYITQVAVRPPTFVLSVNQPDGVHFSYRRYITNRLREEFGFVGTPLRLICRGRKK